MDHGIPRHSILIKHFVEQLPGQLHPPAPGVQADERVPDEQGRPASTPPPFQHEALHLQPLAEGGRVGTGGEDEGEGEGVGGDAGVEHEGEEEEGVGGVAAAGEGLEEGVPEGEVVMVGEEEGEEVGVVGGEGGDDAAGGGGGVVVGRMGWKSGWRG